MGQAGRYWTGFCRAGQVSRPFDGDRPIRPGSYDDQLTMAAFSDNEREEDKGVNEEAEDEDRRKKGDEDENVEDEIDAGDEPGRDERVVCAPYSPTRKEREQHMATHWPYRSWCPHCVRGKAIASHHRRKKEDEEERQQRVPMIAMDYAFLGNEDDGTVPILTMKDDRSGATMATAVRHKGTGDGWALEYALKFIKFLGYKRIILKSDQEPAMMDFKTTIQKMFEGEAMIEDSQVKDKATNGFIENSIREVEGMIRTLKDQVEKYSGVKVNKDSPLLPWLVIHASNLITCYKIQPDGRSSYQRLKGKRAYAYIAPFGEKVLYQAVSHNTRRNKLDSKWEYGIYLGLNLRSMESYVSSANGVKKVRNVRRLAEEDRWDGSLVVKVTGTPWKPEDTSGKSDAPVNMREHPVKGPEKIEEATRKVLRLKIRKEDIEKYGATEGCPGCKATIHGKYTAAHLEGCRRRLEEAISRTPQGAVRVERRKMAFDEELAEEVEAKTKHARKEDTMEEQDPVADGRNQEGSKVPGGAQRGIAEEEGEGAAKRSEQKEEENRTVKKQRMQEGGSTSSSSSSRHYRGREHPGDDDESDVTSKRRRRNDGDDDVLAMTPKLAKAVGNYVKDHLIDFTRKKANGRQWDFSQEEERAKAMQLIRKRKPQIIVGTMLNNKVNRADVQMENMGKMIDHANFLGGHVPGANEQWQGHDLRTPRGGVRVEVAGHSRHPQEPWREASDSESERAREYQVHLKSKIPH